MTESNHFRGGSTHSRGTTFTYGVSCGTSETDGMANRCADLHGRARAAEVVQEINRMLQQLAAEVPTRDFVWARLAIDSCIDDILFGHQPE
jgi:hypothetical protein